MWLYFLEEETPPELEEALFVKRHGVARDLSSRRVEDVVPRLGRSDEMNYLYSVAVPETFKDEMKWFHK